MPDKLGQPQVPLALAGVHVMGEVAAGSSGRVGRGRRDPVWGSGEGCKARGAAVFPRCWQVAVGDGGGWVVGIGIAVIQAGLGLHCWRCGFGSVYDGVG